MKHTGRQRLMHGHRDAVKPEVPRSAAGHGFLFTGCRVAETLQRADEAIRSDARGNFMRLRLESVRPLHDAIAQCSAGLRILQSAATRLLGRSYEALPKFPLG